MTRSMFTVFVALTVAVLFGATAQAQQPPKSGKYSGKFGNQAITQPAELALDASHMFSVGMSRGIFFNDITGGFLDKTEVTCAGASDIVDGIVRTSSGYCTVTDADGDKAFLSFQGKGTAPGSVDGTFQWTGGTGKYTGLQGNNTYQPRRVGKTAVSSIPWSDEWRLP